MELNQEEEKRYYTFMIVFILMVTVLSFVLGYRVYEYFDNRDAQKQQAEIINIQPEAESSCYCTVKILGKDSTLVKHITITNGSNIRLHQLINVYYSAKNDKVILESEFGFGSTNVLLACIIFILTLCIIYAKLFPHNVADALDRYGD